MFEGSYAWESPQKDREDREEFGAFSGSIFSHTHTHTQTHTKPIPEDKVKGRANVWTQSPGQQQQYKIDVQTIEELFGQTDCQSPGVTMATRGGKARSSVTETKDKIRILNSKTEMNVGIYLKHFRKSNQEIIQDIRNGNSKPYGAALLQDLLKLLPETEEAKKLQAFKGDLSKLSLVDSFMFLLTQVQSFEVRIQAMALKEVFPQAFENTSRDIDILQIATKEILGCEELHAVLHLVLQAGNLLNAGGYAGNAVGFKLSSLLTLADTKANKPDMNLLHFVAMEAQKKDEKLLQFPEKLQHVQSAARISLEILDAELHSLSSRTCSVEESIQGDSELLEQLDQFLQSSTAALVELRRRREDLTKEGNILIDFFCEDKETFKLDEGFRVFQDFSLKFQKAVKDNREREQHRNRLRQLEEKRHSWTCGEVLAGDIGTHSSSESDLGHLQLAKSRPHSPHSAFGRSGSIRRSRGSASAAADRQLTSLLTLGLTSDLKPSPWRRLSREVDQQETSPTRSPDSPKISPLARLQTQGPREQTSPLKQHTSAGTGAPHIRPAEADFADRQPDINSNTSDPNHSCLSKPVDHHPGTDPNHNQASGLNVNVKQHTLVAGLQAFDQVLTPYYHHRLDNQEVAVLEPGHEELPPVCEGREELVEEKEETLEKEDQFLSQAEKEDFDPTDGPVHSENSHVWEGPVALTHQKPASSSTSKPPADPSAEPPADTSTEPPAKPPSNTRPSQSQPRNEHSVPASAAHQSVPSPGSACTNQPEGLSPLTNGLPPSDRSAQTPTTMTSRLQPPTMSLSAGRKQVIRTLTTLENQDMRRVVPISKPRRRSLIPGKRIDKPPGHQTSNPGTPSSNSNPSNPHLRPVDRSATASSRTSLHTDDSKEPKVPAGVRGSARPQPSTLQRKPSFRKPVRPVVPRPPPEEKICRATLRALAAAGGVEGNSLSAPSTPAHGEGMYKHSPKLPSFARNTAASSFRLTHSPTSLTASRSSPTASCSSPGTLTNAKTSPRSSPVPSLSPTPGPLPLTRVGSLRHPRVTTSGPPGKDSALRRTQSIRGPSRPPRTPLPKPLPPQPIHDALAIPKGLARTNSGSSDKSTNSRDSSKGQKPTWR
ncbi:hypothetical protein DPEC_G00106200 [Dallia pectoralis]|uniref:Uncharacterized protein n=1 Tax=Dallia pectoralis TaxID=75939 RepID=A0ACC2GXR1_DALPE|nr:hypothetical protein DPEC_G00106200 [Dallia pectoralis]